MIRSEEGKAKAFKPQQLRLHEHNRKIELVKAKIEEVNN